MSSKQAIPRSQRIRNEPLKVSTRKSEVNDCECTDCDRECEKCEFCEKCVYAHDSDYHRLEYEAQYHSYINKYGSNYN